MSRIGSVLVALDLQMILLVLTWAAFFALLVGSAWIVFSERDRGR